MIEFQLETSRLLLHAVTPKLIKLLFETKSKEEILQFFDTDDAGFNRYQVMYDGGMETFQLSFLYFLLIDKSTLQQIGECGFHTWNKKHHRAEIFYLLKEDQYKRKGFMTEALTPILDFGFGQMALHRIEALIGAENKASLKIINNFGFTHEGVMRQDYYINGLHEDSMCFSLLKNEWNV